MDFSFRVGGRERNPSRDDYWEEERNDSVVLVLRERNDFEERSLSCLSVLIRDAAVHLCLHRTRTAGLLLLLLNSGPSSRRWCSCRCRILSSSFFLFLGKSSSYNCALGGFFLEYISSRLCRRPGSRTRVYQFSGREPTHPLLSSEEEKKRRKATEREKTRWRSI